MLKFNVKEEKTSHIPGGSHTTIVSFTRDHQSQIPMKFLHSPLTEVVLNMKNLCRWIIHVKLPYIQKNQNQ